MTDLVSLTDITTQLQQLAETRLSLADAYRIAQQTQATYEADRTAKAATIDNLTQQVTTLTNQAQAQGVTLANLTTDKAVLTDSVNSLTAQVATLTQQVNTLSAQTQAQIVAIGNLTTDKAALTNTVNSLTAQVATLTQSNTDKATEITGDNATIAALHVQVTDLSPDVSVTVGDTSVVSRTVPAVSFVEQTPLWNTAAWPAIKASVSSCVGATKIHVYPFGLLDPWGDATKPIDLTTGNRLATGLAKLREVSSSAPIILTLYGAEWWMKHTVFNGVITDMTSAQAFSDSGRVKYPQLAKWLQLVDAAVALAAGQGCRDFEIWNELKGYYDVYPHVGQKWDASMGTSPVMGYSYFAQSTIGQVIATMTRLGIARAQYRITAPYMMFRSQGAKGVNSIPSTHPLYQYGTSWGYADKMGDNALRDFLSNAQTQSISFDALGLDMATGNSDGVYATADPFDLVAKFGHYLSYVRGLLPTYGMSADMPVDFCELYPMPQPQYRDANSEALRAAVWADCLRQCVLGRVRYPIMWGSIAPVNAAYDNLGGLIAADGTLQKTGEVFRLYRDNFGPGTTVYPLVASDSSISGLYSDNVAVMINRTNTARKVALASDVYELAAYDVRAVLR